MGTYAKENACDFIVALGYVTIGTSKPDAVRDNFYDDGVESASDSRWDYLWKDVYHGAYSSL